MVSYTNQRLPIVASDVCKDLVLYDIPERNPFRELIPLTHKHPVLLQIIIATSALHISNACQKSLLLDVSASSFRHCQSLPASVRSSAPVVQRSESRHDALTAKQQAIRSLQSLLTGDISTEIDVTLAVVLLFIEYELIDSGRDNWRYHVNGARAIVERLCGPEVWVQTETSSLRRCLIANCLLYVLLLDILETR